MTIIGTSRSLMLFQHFQERHTMLRSSLYARWKIAMLVNQTQRGSDLAMVEQMVEVAGGSALMSGRQRPLTTCELKQRNLERK